MREIFFNPQIHLIFFSLIMVIGCLVHIMFNFFKIIQIIENLDKWRDKENWTEIPINIRKKGYYIHHEFPHRYSRKYSEFLTEKESNDAAEYEFKHVQQRIKKREEEKKSGNVTISYVDDKGTIRNDISISNNADINYQTLMQKEEIKHAYRRNDDHDVVVLRIPDELELKTVSKKLYFKLIKSSTLFLSATLLIAYASITF